MSLLPAIKGGDLPERSLIWHYPHYGNQGGEPSSIIREGDWKLIYYYESEKVELYNLATDLEEQENVASGNPEKAASLKEQLFNYLNKVGAKFPKKDPEYDIEKERAYLLKVENELMPRLEEKRMEILAEDFDAGDWWGSEVSQE